MRRREKIRWQLRRAELQLRWRMNPKQLYFEARKRLPSGIRQRVHVHRRCEASTPPEPHAAQGDGPPKLPIAIKLPASTARRSEWGDSHFADALARALAACGHPVRVDTRDAWDTPDGPDTVRLVLRGLEAYRPPPGARCLMWMISHPDQVTEAELAGYEHVFVASEPHADALAAQGFAASPLLQCTDPALFYPCPDPAAHRRLLFVGNSRRQLRPVVRDTLALGFPLEVFGGGWEFLPRGCWRAPYIPNPRLAQAYASADVLLNDHWPDMRARGFISNRLFDAVAAGAVVVSDPVPGLRALFGDSVHTYEGPAQLKSLLTRLLADPAAARRGAAERAAQIAQDHSFAARAAQISAYLARA